MIKPSDIMKGPKQLDAETQEVYKCRRRDEQRFIDEWLRGRPVKRK